MMLMAGIGLTSPIGRLITWTSTGQYCAPAIGWGIAAILIWEFGFHKNLDTWKKSGFICMGFAIASTQFVIKSPLTSITLFLCAFQLLRVAITQKDKIFLHLHSLVSLIAVYFLIFYLLPSSNKPKALVLPILSLSTLIIAAAIAFLPMLWKKKSQFIELMQTQLNYIAGYFLFISTILVLSSIIFIYPNARNLDSQSYLLNCWFTIFSLIGGFTLSIFLGNQSKRSLYYYLFQLLVIATFYFLRIRTPWLNFLAAYEPHTLMIIATSFFQINLIYQRNNQPKLAKPFVYAAWLLPILAIAYRPWEMSTSGSAIFILAAVHFAMIYFDTQKRIPLVLALVLLNISLFQFWRSYSVIDPQFYAIPVGLTLLAIAEINRKEFTKEWLLGLRIAGMAIIYGSSGIQVLMTLQSPVYWLVLGVLSLTGLIIGVWRNSPVYTYTAALFLVTDIVGYALKYGADHGIMEGMLMVLAGLTLLGLSLFFHIQRQRKNQSKETENVET